MSPPLKRIINYSEAIKKYSEENEVSKDKLIKIINLLIKRISKLNKNNSKISNQGLKNMNKEYNSLKKQTRKLSEDKRILEKKISLMQTRHERTIDRLNNNPYGRGNLNSLKEESDNMKLLQEENKKLNNEIDNIRKALDKMYLLINNLIKTKSSHKENIKDILETLKTSKKDMTSNLGKKNKTSKEFQYSPRIDNFSYVQGPISEKQESYPQIGYQQPQIGYQQPQIGYQQPQMGYQQPSFQQIASYPQMEYQQPRTFRGGFKYQKKRNFRKKTKKVKNAYKFLSSAGNNKKRTYRKKNSKGTRKR